MIFLLCTILILFFYKAKLNVENCNSDYLSVDTTLQIRGLLAYFIVCHHIISSLLADNLLMNFEISIYSVFVKLIRGAVATFFFYSGYGLIFSLKNKTHYIKNFFRNRILPLVVFYAFVCLIVLFIKNIFFKLSIKEMLIRTIVKGSPFVNNSWYIICIIVVYFLFLLSYAFIKNRKIAFIIFNILLLGYVYVCQRIGYADWWYITVFGFSLGIFWEENKVLIDKIIGKTYLILLPVTLFLFFFLDEFYNEESKFLFDIPMQGKRICGEMASLMFVTFLMILLNKIKIGNKALTYLGKISLELYIVHGLFIFIYENQSVITFNKYLFIILIVVLSIISAKLLNYVNIKINKLFKKI